MEKVSGNRGSGRRSVGNVFQVLNLEYLAELAIRYRNELDLPVKSFGIKGSDVQFGREPALMGVVNLSRESWYRESVAPTVEAAIHRGNVLAAQGAAIIDLGAESTLPNAARVDASSQIEQLCPVIQGLSSVDALISVETYAPEVARACLEAGASVLNLTGTGDDKEAFDLAVEFGAAVILCFVKGENVREVSTLGDEGDPITPLVEHFAPRVEMAEAAGLERLFIDPGLGFYYGDLTDGRERVARQSEVFLNSFRLKQLGYPICQALPHAFDFFLEEVRTAEGVFAVLAAIGGCDLFRTHEVPRVRAVLETLGVVC